MKNLILAIGLAIIFSIGMTIGWIAGSVQRPQIADTIIYSDTVLDTVPYPFPVPVDSIVVKYKAIRLPIYDTIKTASSGLQDSVTVEVPIQQKEYRDTNYHAWVSGFQPSLDSIEVYSKTIYETKLISIKDTRRWGLGVHAGIGFNGKQIGPYIGIGVSYNLKTW